MSYATCSAHHSRFSWLRTILPVFALVLIHATDAHPSSLSIERAALDREIDTIGVDESESYANALTLRLGGASRQSFLKVLEVRYVEEGLTESSTSQKFLLQQLSISTSTTRGKMTSGLSTFGFGLTGLRYQNDEDSEIEYFGFTFSAAAVKPLISTRLFARGAIGGDYFVSTSAEENDSTDTDSSVSSLKAEVGIVYSFPKFDLGASYSFRRLSISDIRASTEEDTAHGPVLLARIRFGG